MGIAVVSIASGLCSAAGWAVAPLQALVSFFAPWQSDQRSVRHPAAPVAATPVAPIPPTLSAPLSMPRRQAAAKTVASCRAGTSGLRVLRVAEPTRPRHCAGRMVISGRMADVCAELERLAQQEDRAS